MEEMHYLTYICHKKGYLDREGKLVDKRTLCIITKSCPEKANDAVCDFRLLLRSNITAFDHLSSEDVREEE